MAKASIKQVQDGISKQLEELKTRGDDARAFLKLKVFPMYQELQRERWMTEGASEGSTWQGLTPVYRLQKLNRFSSYPGGGRKIMIATGALFEAAVGNPGQIYGKRSMVISVNPSSTNPESGARVIDYAQYAGRDRPFMSFGKESENKIKSLILCYLKDGARGN